MTRPHRIWLDSEVSVLITIMLMLALISHVNLFKDAVLSADAFFLKLPTWEQKTL